ncbi:MAG: DUF1211 domain-containing protein [Candidatus Eremiobacteraeota bacterium]|nr:DUF1211 domain-containing protein [Candidatus Eremiobacteraeota bacterium]
MERDERTIHRLEAFSDIVIAFSLAEVGMSLAIPNGLAQMRSSLWVGLTAFLFSFILISIVWWYHHKLFVTYVYLNPATVALNFSMLGSLALSIYFQQITVHFAVLGIDARAPLHVWLGCMAMTVAFLAGMYAVGIWERRRELDATTRHRGMSLTFQAFASALGLAGLAITFPNNLRAVVAIVVVTGILTAFCERFATYFSTPARS